MQQALCPRGDTAQEDFTSPEFTADLHSFRTGLKNGGGHMTQTARGFLRSAAECLVITDDECLVKGVKEQLADLG